MCIVCVKSILRLPILCYSPNYGVKISLQATSRSAENYKHVERANFHE